MVEQKFGAVFPRELSSYPNEMFDWVKGVENLGLDYIVVYDHVVLKSRQEKVQGQASYSLNEYFNEPLILLAAFSAITTKLRLFTGVLVLPQRQTVLVAKQAAELDHISNGRLSLGVGVGWNTAEYNALGIDYHKRGKIIEEQIKLLRLLWTNETITYNGPLGKLESVGIKPNSIQKPIPIWMGGLDPKVIERMAKLADGWVFRGNADRFLSLKHLLLKKLEHNGRNLDEFGIMGKVNITKDGGIDKEVQKWINCGATHISFSTTGKNTPTADMHLEKLKNIIEHI